MSSDEMSHLSTETIEIDVHIMHIRVIVQPETYMPHTSQSLEFLDMCQPNTILALEKIYGSALVVDFWKFKAEAAFAIEDSSSFFGDPSVG